MDYVRGPLHGTFVSGLRNIRAVETESIAILRTQVRRSASYPLLRERLNRHIEDTRVQMGRLDVILDGMRESNSVLMDITTSIMGGLAALSQAATADEILRNTVADLALENLEIASYRALIIMAREIGHDEAANLLQQSLGEEMEMAHWLQEHLADITYSYMEEQAREFSSEGR